LVSAAAHVRRIGLVRQQPLPAMTPPPSHSAAACGCAELVLAADGAVGLEQAAATVASVAAVASMVARRA
jgi:hypothetical protein